MTGAAPPPHLGSNTLHFELVGSDCAQVKLSCLAGICAGNFVSLHTISQRTDTVTPSVQSLEPINISIPPIQFSQTIDAATSSSVPVVSPPSIGRFVLSDQPQMSKRRFSRRAILAGLTGIAGLTVVGGGITWLIHSHTSGNTYPTGMSGPINIVWQSECDVTGVYAALVDNYNKTNRDGVHVTWRDGPAS